MRKLPLHSVKEGQVIARPIYNSNGQILLQSGIKISRRYVDRLMELGISAVYVEDELSTGIRLEDVIPDEIRLKSTQLIKNLFTRHAAGHLKEKAYADIDRVTTMINEIIDELLNKRSVVVNLIDIRTYDDYLFAHSVNVCVLAVLTGITLGFSRVKLSRLAAGALLHDIGMIKMPRGIYHRLGMLTPAEQRELEKHPVYGYDILSRELGLGKLCALIALQHHERYSGQGYPKQLKQDEIHEMAAITGLVDFYDQLTSALVQRRSIPPNEVYELIAGTGDLLFDIRFVRAFLANITPYPAGSLVRLNTGEVAIVLENRRDLPLRPKIRILVDADGKPVDEPLELWLTGETGKTITALLDDIWPAEKQ